MKRVGIAAAVIAAIGLFSHGQSAATCPASVSQTKFLAPGESMFLQVKSSCQAPGSVPGPAYVQTVLDWNVTGGDGSTTQYPILWDTFWNVQLGDFPSSGATGTNAPGAGGSIRAEPYEKPEGYWRVLWINEAPVTVRVYLQLKQEVITQ